MDNKLTTIAPYPAIIAKMVPNPAEANALVQEARVAFERETHGRGITYEWSDTGECYTDYQTRWSFEMFFVGYRAGREE